MWGSVTPYVVSWARRESSFAVAKDKRRLLEELRQKKRSCSQAEAEAALMAWGFAAGRSKGPAQVWSYRHITLTVHAPHGGRDMNAGAVAMIIRKIEEADILQQLDEGIGDDHAD